MESDERFEKRSMQYNGSMPAGWELPAKEQELIRAIMRDDYNAEACAAELVKNYDWGKAKAKRFLENMQ